MKKNVAMANFHCLVKKKLRREKTPGLCAFSSAKN